MEIQILPEHSLHPIDAFIKANSYILMIHKEKFKDKTLFEKFKILEDLWFIEFGARLTIDKNIESKFAQWSKIKFKNELEKTLFLLKWG